MKNDTNLIWIDLEMTGLDPEHNRIIEIATIVTDSQLNILSEGPVFAIHQSDTLLDKMDRWNKTHHSQSGLMDRVQKSTINEIIAENETLHFLKKYVSEGVSPMCGNSICTDRRFLAKYMPKLDTYFHYRHIDVSTIKELAKRWAVEVYQNFQKENKHLALDDIKESIKELQYYRQNLFK